MICFVYCWYLLDICRISEVIYFFKSGVHLCMNLSVIMV